MNFSKFDISVLIVMSLAVIIMTFTFPALGMSNDSPVNESDVPEFNISKATFDLTGALPDPPRTSDTGQIRYEEDGAGSGVRGVSLIYIQEPDDNGFSIEVANLSTGPRISAINWTSGSVGTQNDYSINNETGQTILHDANGFVIEFTVSKIENYNDPNMTILVDFDIKSAPDDSQGVSAIPIIGSTADLVATVLGYFVTVFSYFSLVLVEIVINTISVIVNLAAYMVGQGIFLAATYGSIVSSAPAWASAILAIPGLLITAEFAKLGILLIKMFPTT